ncbi:unnamed protein product [Psylliodes chrysocephalus]|uniref:Uncharacterized protein n=1 Tax=Psylliodes chrysocephalus TaxID=3402493 RepID=A0A9P0DC98_9CUCU|nr:unnamed protein product [Psylliodes chrysocephala]
MDKFRLIIKSAKASTIAPDSSVISEIHDASKTPAECCGVKISSSKPKSSIIGPRTIQVFISYLPSIGYFTVAGALCTIYLCEWKSVLQYVPFYGGKYDKKED